MDGRERGMAGDFSERERENVYIFGGNEEMGRPSEKDSAAPENKAK